MENGSITTPEQFKDDMILTFANAMKYNPPEHDVHKMAKSLNEMFVQKWEKEEDSIKQKWRLESSGGTHTPSLSGVHTSESIGPISITSYIETADNLQHVGTGKRLLDSDFKDDTPMTYEEKREVILCISKLAFLFFDFITA